MLFRASITTLRLTDQSQTWRNNWLYLYLFDYFRLQALSLKDGPSARQCSQRTLRLSVAGRELGTNGRRLTASALSKSIASYGRTRPLYKRRGDWNRRTFSMGPHVWHVLHELLTAKGTGLEKWKLKIHKQGLSLRAFRKKPCLRSIGSKIFDPYYDLLQCIVHIWIFWNFGDNNIKLFVFHLHETSLNMSISTLKCMGVPNTCLLFR